MGGMLNETQKAKSQNIMSMDGRMDLQMYKEWTNVQWMGHQMDGHFDGHCNRCMFDGWMNYQMTYAIEHGLIYRYLFLASDISLP